MVVKRIFSESTDMCVFMYQISSFCWEGWGARLGLINYMRRRITSNFSQGRIIGNYCRI